MTMDDVRQMLAEARPAFYQYPEPVRVYLHWTAGHYYIIIITMLASIAAVMVCGAFVAVRSVAWGM